MKLTNENYFSPEASREYISVSQYKEFMGSLGKNACESMAIAKLKGEWVEDTEQSQALMVGSYVDAHFEGTLDLFKAQHSGMFKRDGGLKAEYVKANEIINRIERDELFMQYMSGQKQVIMTAELFGAKWKIKIDSYLEDKAIVDLKVMKSLTELQYVKDYGRMDFIQYWGYDIQGAVYQEVVYQNTGKRLPFFIAAASKEKETDIRLFWVDDNHLQEKLVEVEKNTPKILQLKQGLLEPVRCEQCDYCKHTRVLKKPIHFSELMGAI